MKSSHDVTKLLRGRGIQPSAQRITVAQCVLHSRTHPTAQEIWTQAKEMLPIISRATVYNTLNLLVERQLLRQTVMDDGRTVYDPRLEPHHHFIDDTSGRIYDIPWDELQVGSIDGLDEFDVREYQVVLRGRLKNDKRT